VELDTEAQFIFKAMASRGRASIDSLVPAPFRVRIDGLLATGSCVSLMDIGGGCSAMVVTYTPSAVGKISISADGREGRSLMNTHLNVYPPKEPLSRPGSALQGPTFASMVTPMAAPWRHTPTPRPDPPAEEVVEAAPAPAAAWGWRQSKPKSTSNAELAQRARSRRESSKEPRPKRSDEVVRARYREPVAKFKAVVAFGQSMQSPVRTKNFLNSSTGAASARADVTAVSSGGEARGIQPLTRTPRETSKGFRKLEPIGAAGGRLESRKDRWRAKEGSKLKLDKFRGDTSRRQTSVDKKA